MNGFMKETETLVLATLEDTARFAGLLAAEVVAGQFLALCGDLGAGKTTLTRCLTEALACQTLATSPTFSLFQQYDGGRLPVLHGDLYRIGSEDEMFDLGWEEMLSDYQNGLVIVEWAEKFRDLWPPDSLELACSYGPDDQGRAIDLRAKGPLSSRLEQRLTEKWWNA